MRRLALSLLGASLLGCPYHAEAPRFSVDDARAGRFVGATPSKAALCNHWLSTTSNDEWAMVHTSFPEKSPEASCFTPVTHTGRTVTVPLPPRGCAFPENVPAIDPSKLLVCTPVGKERVLAHNARVIDRLRHETKRFPYAAVVVAGEGIEKQTPLLPDWLPDDACTSLDDPSLRSMLPRSERAADAIRGDVAPVVIVTGGAVHSRLVEAYALLHLLACREHIDPDRILIEPCAEHTHTNLRNAAAWIDAMGGRAGYLVTNDSLQADYFQDASMFDFIFGTIDQRSLRDWGWLIGSWHQASIGNRAGFWLTPYRFWAEPRDGLGSVSCVSP